MSSQVNDVFNAFVEAQKAMQRLPEAEAELNRAQGEKEVLRARLESSWNELDAANNGMKHLGQQLADTGEALKAATFREQQLRDQLTLLLGSLKGIVSESNTAIELVEPKPEPVVEVNVSTDLTATSASFLSTENGAENGEGASTIGTETSDAVSVSSDPTATSTDGTGNESVSVPHQDAVSSASVADPSIVDLPGKFPWEAPKIGDAEDYSYMHTAPNNGEHGRPSKEEMEATRELEVNPTAGSTEGGVDAISKNVAPTSAVVQDTSSPSTDETKYYWHKPTSQTWGDWVDAGGEIAPWLKNYPREQLNFAF